MLETTSSKCPVSEMSLEEELQPALAEWIGDRSVYWDEGRNAWIVTGHAEGSKILEDASAFWRDVPLRDGSAEFWGRHLLVLEGRDHRRLHALHMQLTGEAFAESIRERANKICRDLCANLVKQGRGELVTDYADKVIFMIGCDFVGYGIEDEKLTSELLELMQVRAKWKEDLHAGDGVPFDSEVAQSGHRAIQNMASLLLPIIRQRREQPKDDLISALWEKGPGIFSDWNETDILNTCWSSIDNETKPLLRGLLYTLCRDQELQAKLRANPELVAGFVEEGLRFLTPFRTIRRVVKKDIELGGQQMRAGDSIYLITPLANRDETRWTCPYTFDAEREQESTHFAFGFGPGYCVGRYVGRVEAVEAVKAILSETSILELDPTSAKPVWSGEIYYSVAPINVIVEGKDH